MFRRYAFILLTTVISATVTWWLNNQLGLGPVVASGMIGVLAALLLPNELAVAAYTASFAGMSALPVLASAPMALLAGVLVGLIFMVALPAYQGFGGKLGTIAACAVLLTVAVFNLF
jgi:hypothetical protein